MYGHNNVGDGWAGGANTHPHWTPHPTPFPTQTHTQKASKTLVFPLLDSCSRSDRRMDGRTEGPTDGQSFLQSCVSATKKKDKKTDSEIDRQTERQTDRPLSLTESMGNDHEKRLVSDVRDSFNLGFCQNISGFTNWTGSAVVQTRNNGLHIYPLHTSSSGAFIVTDNRNFNGPLGRSLRSFVRSHRSRPSLTPQRSATLRSHTECTITRVKWE